MSEIVQRKQLSDLIAMKIKDYIVENGLKVGDRLPTEQELADRFGVSRVSIREATKALGFLGIINAAPRRGLTISNLNMERITQFLGFHFAINDYPLDQLKEARIAVEHGGFRRTIQRMQEDPEIYRCLDGNCLNAKQAAEEGRFGEFVELDREFHRELLFASGLEPLIAFHDLIQVFFQHYMIDHPDAQRAIGMGWRDILCEHQAIIDHLRDGNIRAAEDSLFQHFQRTGPLLQ